MSRFKLKLVQTLVLTVDRQGSTSSLQSMGAARPSAGQQPDRQLCHNPGP
eukprot:COSAG01_NODE_75525_length_195_cov_30.656250_1_plen_49_part_01